MYQQRLSAVTLLLAEDQRTAARAADQIWWQCLMLAWMEGNGHINFLPSVQDVTQEG